MRTRSLFYILAALEGFIALSYEIICTRLIATYFGINLTGWAAILGTAMSGLALGYYTGGILSKKEKFYNALWVILYLLSCFLGFLPMISFQTLEYFFSYGIGLFLSSFILVFPICFILGNIGPLTIQLLATDYEKSGKLSGLFFTLSSLGGIIGCFSMAFFLLEIMEINQILLSFSLLINFIITLYLILSGMPKYLLAGIFTGLIALGGYNAGKNLSYLKDRTILHNSNGIMGQLIVEDKLEKFRKNRIMYSDRLPQSWINPFTKISYYNYVHKISALSSVYPENSNALVMGIGGGSSIIEYLRLGFRVDAVELDKNIIQVANEFFGLKEFSVNMINDDARHYINTCNKKYNVILLDIITGESVPSYLFTMESFEKMVSLLEEDGTLFIHFFGAVSGDKSEGLLSLIATLKKINSNFALFVEPSIADGMKIFRLSKKKNMEDQDVKRMNVCCRKYLHQFLKADTTRMGYSQLLTDDKPIMDIYYQKMRSGLNGRFYTWKTGKVEQQKTNP